MPSLPKISALELLRILKIFGFYEVRQKGSHKILKKQIGDTEIGCVVPMQKKKRMSGMQAIREIVPIDNHKITINLPFEFDSKEAEVIVLPYFRESKKRSLEDVSVWDDESITKAAKHLNSGLLHIRSQ